MVSLTSQVKIPSGINQGVKHLRNKDTLKFLGKSRHEYLCHPPGSKRSCCKKNRIGYCPPPTVQAFRRRVVTRDLGPFSITGFDLAVEALQSIVDDIKVEQPEVFDVLGTAGMLCCRRVANSCAISNHAWGMAVDLKIAGKLDPVGNKKTFLGIKLIAPIFHRHRWFWGAGFSNEDSMHFEVGRDLLFDWAEKGWLIQNCPGGCKGRPRPEGVILMFDDDGPKVRQLQTMLNIALSLNNKVDGDFGPNTRTAVIAFQTLVGHSPADGRVRQADWDKLVELTDFQSVGAKLMELNDATRLQSLSLEAFAPETAEIDWNAVPRMGSRGFHSKFGGKEWRFDSNGVYYRKNPNEPKRTGGEPTTCRKIVRLCGREIFANSIRHNIPPELIIMTIATEAAAYSTQDFTGPRTFRKESNKRYSAGPMQSLASTARDVLKKLGVSKEERFRIAPHRDDLPRIPPRLGELPLYEYPHNINCGTAYIRNQKANNGTKGDPLLVAAAFNAGSLRPQKATKKNPFRLRSSGDHLKRAARWYGDACHVLNEVRS